MCMWIHISSEFVSVYVCVCICIHISGVCVPTSLHITIQSSPHDVCLCVYYACVYIFVFVCATSVHMTIHAARVMYICMRVCLSACVYLVCVHIHHHLCVYIYITVLYTSTHA